MAQILAFLASIVPFIGQVASSGFSLAASLSKSVITEMYRFVMRFYPLLIFLAFFVFFLENVGALLVYVAYHVYVSVVLFFSMFLTDTTLSIIYYMFLGQFVLFIGRIVYSFLKS